MNIQADPIVLLPGWSFTPTVWEPLIAALDQRGIHRDRLLTPELPLEQRLTLAQRLDDLGSRLPARAHLIGWSLGGELALAWAQRMPERTASLTLLSSTPCFMNRSDWSAGQSATLLDDFDQRLAANPAALLKRFSMLIRHGDAEAGRDRTLADDLARMNELDPGRLATGLSLLREIDLRATAGTIKVPTLLIHGKQDAVVPIAASEWLEQALSHAELLEIDHASHALPVTHCAEIANFIAARIGASA